MDPSSQACQVSLNSLRRGLSHRAFNRDVESIQQWFTIRETDEHWATYGGVPGLPRFVSDLLIKLDDSFSPLVDGLNTLGFDLISSSNFNSQLRHTATVDRFPLNVPVG